MKMNHRRSLNHNSEEVALKDPGKTLLQAANSFAFQTEKSELAIFLSYFSLPVALIDHERRLICGNKSFSEVFGLRLQEDHRGLKLEEIFQRVNGPSLDNWWQESYWLDPEPFEGIFSTFPCKGERRIYRLLFSQKREDDYRAICFIDITSEISQKRGSFQKNVTYGQQLLSFTTRLMRCTSADDLFTTFCHSGQKYFPFDIATLILTDRVQNKAIRVATFSDQSIQFAGDRKFALKPYLIKLPELRQNFSFNSLESEGNKFARLFFDNPVRSGLILPLLNKGQIMGSLNLGSMQASASTSLGSKTIGMIAEQFAAALSSIQLSEKLAQKSAFLKRLGTGSWSIKMSLNPDRIAENLCETLQEILKSIAGGIQVFNKNELVTAKICGSVAANLSILPNIDIHVLHKRAETGKPIIIRQIWRSRHFSPEARAFFQKHRIQAYLGMPGKSISGNLVLLSAYFMKHTGFFNGEKELISALNAYAIMAIENASLYQRVKENKEFLENILTQSADAIITTDRFGRVTFFGRGAEDMLGYGSAEAVGRPVSDFFVQKGREVRRLFRLISRQKNLLNYETWLKHKNGDNLPFSLSLSPLKTPDGEVHGFLGIGRDVSDIKKAEEELQQRSEELEDLVYLITHNLKTPIVSVDGFANLLIEEIGNGLDEESLRYLDRIRKNAAIMNVMISDLLEFSRFGKMEPQMEQADLQQIVANLIEEFSVRFSPEMIRFEIPEPLPVITGSREGLKAIFENLLSNAIKYRKANELSVIKIYFEEKPRFFAFHVEDNGIGIEPSFRKKIFNLFQRGANVGDVEGTGVGLAICKRIVQKHGGFITVHSTAGEGTIFSFAIPKPGAFKKTRIPG